VNAVEIEEAISRLAEQPFDAAEFPYAFLEAFGNKATTIKRLRSGPNKSDIEGGILQYNQIHLAVSPKGDVLKTLAKLKASPTTSKQKAKFILTTDGDDFQAEDLTSGETIACAFKDFPDHFGFFLPLAGISTVKQISENAFDIRATSRLNRLYVELLKDNPEWGTSERRHDMNHFMARLIFCFFAEDTDIFNGTGLFTATIDQMSAKDSSNTHEVISEIFRAMNTKTADRAGAKLPRWADTFPYVNGGLFSGSTETPRFSKIARSYLLHVGNLDWKKINPDIFGSMIQAVADDDERGALGMHYTSVPNILKVLNPLFLDDLREQLAAAGDSPQKLLNLRKRMARIRVFDPACGSGNFLVIAYKEMRAIEAEINIRRGEPDRRTEIPITNFRGIELRDFPAEIARLALIIAEYQCDVTYRGQKEALAEFLPLDEQNWITCGNALRLDWLTVCEPTGKGGGKIFGDDLFGAPLDQAKIDFENEGGETYICGNPPYLGSKWQSDEQKAELKAIFENRTDGWKSLDYVAGWFMKAADYGTKTSSAAAFVSTNSLCQGQQVPILWPLIFSTKNEISFAHTGFKWANLASHNAGVIVIIVGISTKVGKHRVLFSSNDDGEAVSKQCDNINAYLVAAKNIEILPSRSPKSEVSQMLFGNMPRDGGNFIVSGDKRLELIKIYPEITRFIRPYLGSEQMIQGKPRWCIWIEDEESDFAHQHPFLKQVINNVKEFRLTSNAASTRDFSKKAHRFVQIAGTAQKHSLAVAKVSSERRPYLPVDLVSNDIIISDLLFALYDAPLWNMAIIASRLHLVWIATVCGKMKTDFRYSNTLGWNTFPVPKLTQKNKDDLTRCSEDILLAREAHFPATIADLYDPETMPENLRHAHERNDEVLERIYIGRRFKNNTEMLEALFTLYNKQGG
jgi:hypothetical protein